MVDKNKIYAFRWPGKKNAAEVVLYVDADYHGFKGICFLSPPNHGHMIKGQLGRKTETGFTFIADKDAYSAGDWEFIEITYDNFKQEYHKLVEGGEEILAAVSNTQELQDWYHLNFPLVQD